MSAYKNRVPRFESVLVKYLSLHGRDDDNDRKGSSVTFIFLFDQAFADDKFVDVNP